MLKPSRATDHNIPIISPPVKHPKHALIIIYKLSFYRYLKKNVFLRSNLLRKMNFCRVIEYFLSRFLLLSIYQNTSESIRPCFRKKSDMSQQPQKFTPVPNFRSIGPKFGAERKMDKFRLVG